MKKVLFAMVSVVLLFATSCEDILDLNLDDLDDIEDIEIPKSAFLVNFDHSANPQNAYEVEKGISTMTFVDNNVYAWSEFDMIAINGNTYVTATEGSLSLFFPYDTLYQADVPPYHAFYPASIADTGAAGTLPKIQFIDYFGNAAAGFSNLPMYAYSENVRLTFHNICAAIMVDITDECDSIVVSADENICGEFTVDSSTYAAQLAKTGDHLRKSLKAIPYIGYFQKGRVAYIAIPAGTYTNFNVKLYDGRLIVNQVSYASLTVDVNKVYHTSLPQKFCFIAQTETTIGMASRGASAPAVSLEYSVNDVSTGTNSKWKTFSVGSTSIHLDPGDKVFFMAGPGGNNAFAHDDDNYNYFTSTGSVKASGNIMSLLDPIPATTLTSSNQWAFCQIFDRMSGLTDASELVLPATTLSSRCYSGMFFHCENLTAAPELPATTLANDCYREMFQMCESLTAAPSLPATTLAESCYRSMFANCTGLTIPPTLFSATNLASYCCYLMFSQCKNLAKAPALPATTLAEKCYSSMFKNCENLRSAPDLPAQTLAVGCYMEMFDGCSNLRAAPVISATTMAKLSCQKMFGFCTSLTAPPALPATTLADSCYHYMFMSCENLTEAPVLPAQTLTKDCYLAMFYMCSKLTTVTMKATNIPQSTPCLVHWLSLAGDDESVTSRTVNIDPSITTLDNGVGAIIKSSTSSRWRIKNNNTTNPVDENGTAGL